VAARKTSRAVRRRLVWTDRALRDLEAIDAYIAADDPEAAVAWIDKLLAAAQRASHFPQSGHVVREKGRADLRQILVRTYRIIYRIGERDVLVLTVLEGHMQLPEDVD
jgi:addiction module RelE/StbE family toxin